MDVSKFLSKVIGVYLVIISIVMITNMHQFTVNITKLINDEPLMFVTGFFTLILGVLVVISHNVWQWNWRVIITIIAWISLFKGTTILLCPQLIDKTTIIFVQHTKVAYIAAGIDLALGLLLSYFGFRTENKR